MKATTRIAVVGAGVAGSFLAFLLSRVGFKVVVFDMYKFYVKPCGEAVPEIVRALARWARGWLDFDALVRHRIKAIVVCVDKRCRTIDFGKVVGYVIDKRRLVAEMRRAAMMLGAKFVWGRVNPESLQKFDMVVDARGPFSNAPEYDAIVAARGFVDGEDEIDLPGFTGNKDTLHFWFSSSFMGYAWAFPATNDEWNVGVGGRIKGLPPLTQLIKKYFPSATNIEASKIKIVNPKHAIANNVVRIGEAGGFIVPYTGEGIRPALESAKALFEDLLTEKRFDTFNTLRQQYKKHHKCFRLLRLVGPKIASRVLLKADAQTFIDLLNGRISLYKLFRLLV